MGVMELVAEAVQRSPAGARLNVGCGWDVMPGWVNLDLAPLPGVDVAARVGADPLPFASGSFSVVLARDLLEHVDLVPAMAEFHRLLRPGGRLVVSTVHFTSRDLWVDPTHIRGFSARTFEYFARGSDRSYYFDFDFEALERVVIDFPGGRGRWMVWNRPVKRLANRSVDLYEMTGLSRAFPAGNLLAVLRR